MTCICVVQWHFTDIKKSEQRNVFEVISKMTLFDHTVIAVPDVEENRQLAEHAKKWGVDIFYGDTNNLLLRLQSVIEHYDAHYIVRPNIDWFYMNPELIENMLCQLEENSLDYVKLPYDMDTRFGADVFSKSYIEKLITYTDANPETLSKYGFYIYCASEELDIFNTEFIKTIPERPASEFDPIYEAMKIKWKSDGTDYSDRPIASYKKAANYIDPGDTVLDCACGTGFGTKILSNEAKAAIGVDIEKRLIDACNDRFGDDDKISYILGDIFKLDLNMQFDKIITLHTMEHLESDDLFLQRLSSLLKSTGQLILEVPLFTKSIFKGVTTPLNPTHIREYNAYQLIDLCKKYFDINQIFGFNRGIYVERNRARNAMMIIMSHKKPL